MFYTFFSNTPFNEIILTSDGYNLTGLYFNGQIEAIKVLEKSRSNPIFFKNIINQLDEYFNGKRLIFNIPVSQPGTVFQQLVWKNLQKIKYGTTISYKELAHICGREKAIRAVGGANSKNLINIIIPCHRVISSDQKINGYNAGIENKKWLLQHESKILAIGSKNYGS